jgi:hypothetical protein
MSTHLGRLYSFQDRSREKKTAKERIARPKLDSPTLCQTVSNSAHSLAPRVTIPLVHLDNVVKRFRVRRKAQPGACVRIASIQPGNLFICLPGESTTETNDCCHGEAELAEQEQLPTHVVE